jgi:hypothetical protein
VAILKLALMKFGVGKWKEIVESDCLPGKLIQQLNGQTQRLLGQQSLAGAQRPTEPPRLHARGLATLYGVDAKPKLPGFLSSSPC